MSGILAGLVAEAESQTGRRRALRTEAKDRRTVEL